VPGTFVLGMHRSGTSVVTRVLNLLGLSTCSDADLFPVRVGNAAGHWESLTVMVLNDRRWACSTRRGHARRCLHQGGRRGPRL
jgi:hypothetical protein